LLRAAIFAALFLICALASAPCNAASPLPEGAVHDIDAVFADFNRPDTPGYAIGVVDHGELVFAKGYGQANLDDGIPITPKTVFHLASLSKQFTGAALALMILDGRVSLDDPVSKYIPEAKKFGPGLLVKHLVYMTSGIPDYGTLPRKSGDPWFSAFYFTRDEAIATSLSAPSLLWAPGSKWSYSNVNYMLLTRIVEQVSGRPFGEVLQTRVFDPLGMSSTHLDDDTTVVVPHRAIGYAPRSPEIVTAAAKVGVVLRSGPGYARMMRNSPHFGGSGVFTSLEDLAKWDANWTNPKVGGPAFTALMQSRMKFQHDKDNDAFGLVFGERAGRTMIWYSGEDLDASTYMARFPASGVTVFCLSNMLTGDCEGRAGKVIDALIKAGRL
jgi:CubicO group peptidase (beta-lactamase class C family)